MALVQERAFGLMDEVQSRFLARDVNAGLEQLVSGLRDIKLKSSEDEWVTFSKTSYQSHSICELIYQCPFTKHAFEKPRGYAGDAELIDFIYGFKPAPGDALELGKLILQSSYSLPIIESIRARKGIVAKTIDETAAECEEPIRVLSVACGHLREAWESEAIQAKAVQEVIALDQDKASLALIERELSDYPITTCHRSVVDIVKGKVGFQDLDLVYSSGLYDYLSQPFAAKLTAILFEMLKPGGKLLIANLVPNHPEIGYMETFMQWDLVYRTENELIDIADRIDVLQKGKPCIFYDENKNVVFLKISKDSF